MDNFSDEKYKQQERRRKKKRKIVEKTTPCWQRWSVCLDTFSSAAFIYLFFKIKFFANVALTFYPTQKLLLLSSFFPRYTKQKPGENLNKNNSRSSFI